MRRRLFAALAAATLLPGLIAAKCAPESPPPGQHQPAHNPAVDQPGPQADPGTCVQRDRIAPAAYGRTPGRRDVQIEAHWTSETKVPPVITYAVNGVVTPATNVRDGQRDNPSKLYGGEWVTIVQAQCGDTISVSIAGTRSGHLAMCVIIDLGNGPVKTGERNCEAHYVVP